MSAVVGVFNCDRRPVDDALVRRMLAQTRSRGADRTAVWTEPGAALATARNAWELANDFSGDVDTLVASDLVVAADASLYYRRDLLAKLAATSARVRGATVSHLILAAYQAWGPRCVEQLEGDYAFIVYDRRSGHVFCARDFGGKRPLYYADLSGTLLVGSTLSAILCHPACPDTFNVPFLAEVACSLWPSPHDTAYEAISLVPAGGSLCWTAPAGARMRQDWSPPERDPAPRSSYDDARQELRYLLGRAVDERLVAQGVTTVWMSGGWDSTAVFGAGQEALKERSSPRALNPVSISYPPGDPGREDELITAAAEWWNTPVEWLDIGDIPLIERPLEGAAARDEPVGHIYENWNRALARGTRRAGARIGLDGNGGDQLFQVSPVFLADLLRTARWGAFAREWRALALRGSWDVWRWGIKPLLGPFWLDVATALRRGRRVHGTYERWMPSWVDRRLVAPLRERQRHHVPPRNGMGAAAYEAQFYLSNAYYPRIFGTVAGLALEEGVEARSPLYDRRVVEFAARRPHWERCSAGETKRLLRHAMGGLLPERLLAPRRFRTGVLSRYFRQGTRDLLPGLVEQLGECWGLAELGIVERGAVVRAWHDYVQGGDPDLGVALLSTLRVEWWLRARGRGEPVQSMGNQSAPVGNAAPAVVG